MGFAWGGASLHCPTSTSTVPRAAPDALKALRSPCTCDSTALGTRKRGAERCGVHLPRFFQIRGGEGGGGKRKQTHSPCYPFPPWCFFPSPNTRGGRGHTLCPGEGQWHWEQNPPAQHRALQSKSCTTKRITQEQRTRISVWVPTAASPPSDSL